MLKQREVAHLRGWDFGPLTLELQEYYQELLQSCFGISDEKRYVSFYTHLKRNGLILILLKIPYSCAFPLCHEFDVLFYYFRRLLCQFSMTQP